MPSRKAMRRTGSEGKRDDFDRIQYLEPACRARLRSLKSARSRASTVRHFQRQKTTVHVWKVPFHWLRMMLGGWRSRG
jgi:hypothetical protein